MKANQQQIVSSRSQRSQKRIKLRGLMAKSMMVKGKPIHDSGGARSSFSGERLACVYGPGAQTQLISLSFSITAMDFLH